MTNYIHRNTDGDRHKFGDCSVEINASGADFLSAATDSYTTQPLSINNEEQRSDRETRAEDVNRVKGSHRLSKGRATSRA